MIDEPIQTRPIEEVLMGPMDPKYIRHVYRFLQSIGCEISPHGLGHRIRLPEGTVEEIYRGQSTAWTHKTLLRFPGGVTLTKYVSATLSHLDQTITMLAFPIKILSQKPL